RYFISTARRKSRTNAESYSHGSRGGAPCVRVCEVSAPKGSQRRYSSRGARLTKPPTSWLKNVNPESTNDSPARSVASLAALDLLACPHQCRDSRWIPTPGLRLLMIYCRVAISRC